MNLPAVAQVGNLLYRRPVVGWTQKCRTAADCQSATQQTASLRYGSRAQGAHKVWGILPRERENRASRSGVFAACGGVALGVALLLFPGGVVALRAGEPTAREVATRLDALRETVAAEVTATLRTNVLKTSYTTVWRNYEDAAIEALAKILPRHIPALTAADFDSGKAGREKNRLADLAITVGGEQIEVSIKAARRSGNPENDMGTFREHPKRRQLFTDSFTLWVRYDDSGQEIRCDRVFFDRTWRLVGKSSLVDGVKYRKKDGNLRPKSWAMFDSGEAFWKSEADFEAAVKRAELYRANELIKEYLDDLSESDQRVLYEKLKGKFQGQRN